MNDLNLTDFEIRLLGAIDPEWTRMADLTDEARDAVDYLVLSDLVERNRDEESWLPEWRLTEAGTEAVAALGASDMAPEPADEPEQAEAPKRIGVGSLVRHNHHGEGLVTDHFMWDGDWGGFRIQLLKPSQTGATTSISEISDRADAFTLMS